MTKKELLEQLQKEPFYRHYLKADTSKDTILQALKNCHKGFAPLYKIDKVGSDYRYTYTHTDNVSIHYHGQLKGVNIDVIKEGVYTIDFYHKADDGRTITTSTVLFILESAI